MRDKMRKKYQNKLNKLVRHLNKLVEQDNEWKGRFIFRQINSKWYKFGDNSGGVLVAFIRAYDKETGYYHDYTYEFAPYLKSNLWHLHMDIASPFIVDHLDYWNKPKTDKDYTKINIPTEKIAAGEWNFYEDYDIFMYFMRN